MNELIKKFVTQLEEAIGISSSFQPSFDPEGIKNIIISGMGGSGIAGSFTQQLMGLYSDLAVYTVNDYDIPKWVNNKTLAIVSSYSGNTEETLSTFKKFREKDAKILIISAGGKLVEMAKELNLDLIKLPDNWPAPRACFGYSLVAQLFTLHNLGFFNVELHKEMSASIELLFNEDKEILKLAKDVALRLNNKIPVIYSNNLLFPVAIRFKQQLNENSKSLAFVNTIPEMNHNELVGWSKSYDDLAVIFIKSNLYSDRVNARIDLSKEIIINYVDTMIELEAKGYRPLTQMLYLVNLVDWISFFLAEQTGVDAMEIKNIDYLKKELSKI